MIYLSAGYAKLVGEQWWNGEAIWRAFLQPGLIHFPFTAIDLATLASYEILFQIAGITVLVLQLGFSFLIFVKPLRRYVLLLTILFHVGIGVFLGLYLFSFTMIVFDAAAFWDFRRRAGSDDANEDMIVD